MNNINIHLGNLTLVEQFEEKALNNHKTCEKAVPLLSRPSEENDRMR